MLTWLKRLFTRKRPTPPLSDLLAAAMRKHQAELAQNLERNVFWNPDVVWHYNGARQDSKGRWRDAEGRFIKNPFRWQQASASVILTRPGVDQTSNTAN